MPALAVPPVSLRRVVLAGYMGSGKTTVGRLLAARLKWSFADLDEEVTRRCGMPVPDIFASFGEPHFRREESRALAECLNRSRLVLALGGGACEEQANRVLLRESEGTGVVYLFGRFETLHERCVMQAGRPGAVVRPVLADFEVAKARFARRAPFYAEIATITIDSESGSPEYLVGKLAAILEASFGLTEEAGETP